MCRATAGRMSAVIVMRRQCVDKDARAAEQAVHVIGVAANSEFYSATAFRPALVRRADVYQ